MMAEKIPNAMFPSITTTYDNPVVYDNDLNHREFQIYFEKELEKEKETETRSMPRNNPENSKSRDTSKDNENDQHSSVSDKKYVSDSYSESEHHQAGSKPDLEIEISKMENNNNNNNNQNELNSNNLKSSISTTDSMTEQKESVRLFKSKSNSRFFTESNILDEPNDDGITIPTFVSKIIQNNMIKNNKKIYKILEKSVLENLIQNNNNNNSNNSISHNWASFINETTQNDKSP